MPPVGSVSIPETIGPVSNGDTSGPGCPTGPPGVIGITWECCGEFGSDGFCGIIGAGEGNVTP